MTNKWMTNKLRKKLVLGTIQALIGIALIGFAIWELFWVNKGLPDHLQIIAVFMLLSLFADWYLVSEGISKLQDVWYAHDLHRKRMALLASLEDALPSKGFRRLPAYEREPRQHAAIGYNSGVVVVYLPTGKCFAKAGAMDEAQTLSNRFDVGFHPYDLSWAFVPRRKDVEEAGAK